MTNKKRARKRRQRWIRRRGRAKTQKRVVVDLPVETGRKESLFRRIARFFGGMKQK